MSLLLLLTLLGLVSENSDLLSLAVLKNLSLNCCAVNIGSTYLDAAVSTESNDLVESNCLLSSMKMISPSFT